MQRSRVVREMKTLLGKLWRKLPPRVRRLGVWLAEARFTATVGAVIVDDKRRVLLLKHRFRYGNGWGIPGGFINAGEQPENALRRELREEIGLNLDDVHLKFVRALRRPRQIEIIYRCAFEGDGEAIASHSIEIIKLGWYAVDKLPAELAGDQHRIIHKALEEAEM